SLHLAVELTLRRPNQMKTSGMKILIAVVMTVVVLATSASSTKDVRDICNYNIGGAKCSACCGRALAHCKLYCINLGCDPNQKGVCDVKNSNKARGCPTCMNDRRRTLESDDPSAVVNSHDEGIVATVVDFFENGNVDQGIVATVDDFFVEGTADEEEGIAATLDDVIEGRTADEGIVAKLVDVIEEGTVGKVRDFFKRGTADECMMPTLDDAIKPGTLYGGIVATVDDLLER
ncbi:Hypothetical predicted protein, partial [Paramuricea clavata]